MSRNKRSTDPQTLWLYGHHAVAAAIANPRREILRLVHSTAETPATTPDRPIRTEKINKNELERLLPAGAVHQGVAVQVKPLPPGNLEEIAAAGPQHKICLLILDQITDPQNVGAILRSAAAFGAAAAIMTGRHAPPESGALAKAASGALDIVPVIRVVNLARALDRIADLGYWRIGLDAKADSAIGSADLSGPVALVLGAEGSGLRRLTREKCDLLLRLPVSAAIESLNVSTAAAIALYEWAREKPAQATEKQAQATEKQAQD